MYQGGGKSVRAVKDKVAPCPSSWLPALEKALGLNPSLPLLPTADRACACMYACTWYQDGQAALSHLTAASQGGGLPKLDDLPKPAPQGMVAASFLVNKQPALGPVWLPGRTRRN